jgi:hypothetical protein
MKYLSGLKSGFVISSTVIFKNNHGLTNLLVETISKAEIFMQSTLLKYKPTVNF